MPVGDGKELSGHISQSAGAVVANKLVDGVMLIDCIGFTCKAQEELFCLGSSDMERIAKDFLFPYVDSEADDIFFGTSNDDRAITGQQCFPKAVRFAVARLAFDADTNFPTVFELKAKNRVADSIMERKRIHKDRYFGDCIGIVAITDSMLFLLIVFDSSRKISQVMKGNMMGMEVNFRKFAMIDTK